MALTRRQREVLDVVRELIEKNGYSPSLEEIGSELGLSSVATVHKHVSHLVQKGYVRRTWNQNRSIELVESGEGQGAVRLPLRGTLGGDGPAITGSAVETIAVPAELVQDAANAFLVRVEGNGLETKQIRHGDLLVIEPRARIRDGETVLVVLDDRKASLRRYHREGPRARLEPDRDEGRSFGPDADRQEIRGVLVGMIRRY
jgi:repressor LexA